MEPINNYRLWLDSEKEYNEELAKWESKLAGWRPTDKILFIRQQLRKKKLKDCDPVENWTLAFLKTKLEGMSMRDIAECMELLDMALARRRLKK